MEKYVLRLSLLILIVVAACSPEEATPGLLTSTPPVISASITATPPVQVEETGTPPAKPTLASLEICSPLSGFTYQDLLEGVVNRYQPPPPGSDNPHQGVDIAELLQPGSIALEGAQVDALMGGTVASIFRDRFPYGTAVLVETTLDSIPPGQLAMFSLPDINAPWQPDPALTCPPVGIQEREQADPSIYILYAHLSSDSGLSMDEPVSCGQPLGTVGRSGNALNPHLHLEMRIGPGGARIPSMAHYDPSASEEEMAAYCTWRISGMFRHFDPFGPLAILQPPG